MAETTETGAARRALELAAEAMRERDEVLAALTEALDLLTDAQRGNWLVRAAAQGKSALVARLLAAGVEPDAISWDETALADGDLSPEGLTALIAATIEGHERVIVLLLAAGADRDARDENGDTPLGWAVSAGQERVVKMLLGAGCDVDLCCDDGWTPLMYAATHNCLEIAILLLGAGADTTLVDNVGRTALQLAERWEGSETAAFLQDFATASNN